MLPLQPIGRLAGPDREHVVDALLELLAPVEIEVAEHFPVGGQPARADPEDEAALEEVVEHRDLGRDRRRVAIWQVDRPRAERDPLRQVGETREEDRAVGDRLRQVGHVLADEGLGIAELVQQQDCLAILAQGLRVRTLRRMERHREVAEPQGRTVQGAFFVDRQLGGRPRLEPLVRNRLPALDRQAVRARSESLLGALDRGQLVAQACFPALVELVLVEVGRLVAFLDVLVLRLTLVTPQPGELALDPPTLGGQQLTCAVGIHRSHLIRGRPRCGRVPPWRRSASRAWERQRSSWH